MMVVWFTQWLSVSAMAQVIGWHDRMSLQLGDGVALNRQQEPAWPGLVTLSQPVSNSGGWSESYTYAQDTYQMVSAISANSSVSVNALAFGGDANVSYFGRQSFSANDLKFVCTICPGYSSVRYNAASFSPDFWNQVGFYGKTLSGAGLHSAITSTFGTHYVAGLLTEGLVTVVYTFHYASASVRQQLSVSADGYAGNFANFSTYVNSFFASTNSTGTMSYDFWSSDPLLAATNLGFAKVGVIESPQQFSTFVGQVRAYATNMARTKITGYILSPIQSGSNYLNTIYPYTPPTPSLPGADAFFSAYSALQTWKQHFDPWVLSGDSMSWLNAEGRQHVLNDWFTAQDYLATLKSVAAGHFTTNGPLTVPPAISDYLSTLSDVTLPTIYYLNGFVDTVGADQYYLVGLVDCGCASQTIPVPFINLTLLYYETNNMSSAPIYYTPAEFQNASLTGADSQAVTAMKNFFGASSGVWNCLTNAAVTSGHRFGYFLANQAKSQDAQWSVAITSGTDPNGNPLFVDEMFLTNTTRNVSCPVSAPCTLAITNLSITSPSSTPLLRQSASVTSAARY